MNVKKNILYASAFCIALSSCGIYKKYERPQMPTEGLYRTEAPQDTSSIASWKWEDLFTDAHLRGG